MSCKMFVYIIFLVWAIYEQVCVAACDCGHLILAKVLSVFDPLCLSSAHITSRR